MIDKEKECKKLFLYQRKYAKHWLTPSAHRAHSSTTFMIDPANKTLEKISNLNKNDRLSFYEKIIVLMKFYIEMDTQEKQVSNRMYNRYYFECYRYLENEMKKIEKEEEVTIYKMPKS